MKKIFLLLIVLSLFSSTFINALTLSPGTVLNTSSSNSSITFSFNVNVKNVTINSNSIFLYWVIYTESGEDKFCSSINFSTLNSNKDSSQFGCPLTPSGGESTNHLLSSNSTVSSTKELSCGNGFCETTENVFSCSEDCGKFNMDTLLCTKEAKSCFFKTNISWMILFGIFVGLFALSFIKVKSPEVPEKKVHQTMQEELFEKEEDEEEDEDEEEEENYEIY